MKITTDKGKTLDINWVVTTSRGGESVMIELEDTMTFAQYAEAFDGAQTITKTDEKKPGVTETYTGYTRLASISRDNAEGVVRIVLKKP